MVHFGSANEEEDIFIVDELQKCAFTAYIHIVFRIEARRQSTPADANTTLAGAWK